MSFEGQPSVGDQVFYERLALALEPEDLQRLEVLWNAAQEFRATMAKFVGIPFIRWGMYASEFGSPVKAIQAMCDAIPAGE